jgi:hypothetical protein
MKKAIIVIALVFLYSCGIEKPIISQPLYDVLLQSEYDGANFQFYEIISEENEFNIILNDDILKKYVKKDDIKTCNFLLLNMGEKNTTGCSVNVVKVKELPDKIEVTIKEIEPKRKVTTSENYTRPYSVVKIKSKKPIEIKTPE